MTIDVVHTDVVISDIKSAFGRTKIIHEYHLFRIQCNMTEDVLVATKRQNTLENFINLGQELKFVYLNSEKKIFFN